MIEINRNLKKYLPKGSSVLEEAMRYSVMSGGKRIRPTLVIESSCICGGSKNEAMPAACAIEFIHAYSLIHDDLPSMDDDDLRRGKPTCHKVFGEANAILAGDALLALAFNIMAAYTKPQVGLEIIKEVSSAIGADGMAGGQALDLENRDRYHFFRKTGYRKMVSVPNLRKINLLKTAKLFAASTKTGALLAGASHKKIDALKKFGLHFGLAFQTVDDYLDGESKAREKAFLFIEKAKKELKVFGKEADRLKRIAEYTVNRAI